MISSLMTHPLTSFHILIFSVTKVTFVLYTACGGPLARISWKNNFLLLCKSSLVK